MGEFLIDVNTVQWVHFGLLVAFTICLTLLLRLTSSSALKLWRLSNVATATAMPLLIWRPIITNEMLAFLLPAILVITSAGLKLLAVSSRQLRRRMAWPLLVAVFVFSIAYQLMPNAGPNAERLALTTAMLSILTAAIALAAKFNPLWRSLWGRRLLIAAFTFASLLLAAICVRAIPTAAPQIYFC